MCCQPQLSHACITGLRCTMGSGPPTSSAQTGAAQQRQQLYCVLPAQGTPGRTVLLSIARELHDRSLKYHTNGASYTVPQASTVPAFRPNSFTSTA
jgi:hypothetical protein